MADHDAPPEHGTAHVGHDDHGHGHGHGSGELAFAIIPENSAADSILNAFAWLACLGLLVFSAIMFTAPAHEREHEDGAGSPPAHEAHQ